MVTQINLIRIWNEGNIKSTACTVIKSAMVVSTLSVLGDVRMVPERDYFWHLKHCKNDVLHLLDIIISDNADLPWL